MLWWDFSLCLLVPAIATDQWNKTGMFNDTANGEAVLNPDGSITLPTENISLSEDQSDLTLTTNITLPNGTVSVGNVMVFVFTDDDLGGRLISHPVNTSGITQASAKAQMVRKFKLETANVTLSSVLTKDSTTNRFKVRSIFKIALSYSTLYRQSFVIRKIVLVVTSHGKHDHQNEQLYLIFYTKSVIVPSPVMFSNVSTVAHSTVRTPISVIILSPVFLSTVSEVAHNTVRTPISVIIPSPVLLSTVSAVAPNTVRTPISVVPFPVSTTVAGSSSSVQNTVRPTATGTSNRTVAIIAVATVFVVLVLIIALLCYCCHHKRKGRKIDATKTAVPPVSENSKKITMESFV
nr:uncharacterized protein LOC131771140 isoform X2 [Pocillopora verrucosa]